MVEENCLVAFEQEPVLYAADDGFLDFRLLVLVSDLTIHVVSTRLRRRGSFFLHVAGLGVGYFDLLDDLLVLEVDFIHFGGRLEVIFGALLSDLHAVLDALAGFFFCEQFVFKDLFPGDSLLSFMLEHSFKHLL